MGYILQACLSERGEEKESTMDTLIEALDDYLHNRSAIPPVALLKAYSESSLCSPELKDVIDEGLREIQGHG